METDNVLSSVLAVLSAMITPAVLISACGSLTISTSNRLARAIDRTRKLSDQLREDIQAGETESERDHVAFLFDQLRRSARRARLLHRALTAVYAALGVFVATSIAIGLIYLSGQRLLWLPTWLSIVGVALLLYGSFLLIAETWIARRAIDAELVLILRLGEGDLPADFLDKAASTLESS